MLTPKQVGSGYHLRIPANGKGVKGAATLDMCGFNFPSEKLRLTRLQVDYVPGGKGAVTVSNEVVDYQPGGASAALAEVTYAAIHCPATPIQGKLKGVPSGIVFHITPIDLATLPARTVAFRVNVSATDKHKHTSQVVVVVVYQVHGDVLSGVYGTGGTLAADKRLALHAAAQSSKNLDRLGSAADPNAI